MRIRYPVVLYVAVLLAFSRLSIADSLAMPAWQQALAAKPEGSAEAGSRLYGARCESCHGPAGVPSDPALPVLAGQRSLYVYKMLLDYRAQRVGGPDAAVMAGVAGGLNEQDMAHLAVYLAALRRPVASRSARAPAILGGDRSRLLPPCEACHGADGQGWDLQPAIAGQSKAYLLAVLNRFKSGERNNDINAGMGQIARRLTETEIQSLAEHFSR